MPCSRALQQCSECVLAPGFNQPAVPHSPASDQLNVSQQSPTSSSGVQRPQVTMTKVVPRATDLSSVNLPC